MNSSGNVFGQSSNNSPFKHPSAYGQSINSPFGQPSTFGQSSNSPFDNPSAFGQSSNNPFDHPSAFGQSSNSPFGFRPPTQSSSVGFSFPQSQTAFITTNSSPSGSTSQPTYGPSNTPASGSTFASTPTLAFASSFPALGSSTTSSSFSYRSTPAFNQSTSASVTSPFISTSHSFSFGSTPASVQSTSASLFGPPTITPEVNSSGEKLMSVSAIPAYNDKSHEELRWNQNCGGCKCCETRFNINNNTHHTNLSPSPAFGLPPTNLFSKTISTSTFATSTASWSTPAPSVIMSTPSAPSTGTGFSFKKQESTSTPSWSTQAPSTPFVQPSIYGFEFDTQTKGTTSASGFVPDSMDSKMNNTQQTNPISSSSPAIVQSSSNPFSFTISINPFDPKANSTVVTPELESSTSSLGSSPSTLVLVFNFKNMQLT